MLEFKFITKIYISISVSNDTPDIYNTGTWRKLLLLIQPIERSNNRSFPHYRIPIRFQYG